MSYSHGSKKSGADNTNVFQVTDPFYVFTKIENTTPLAAIFLDFVFNVARFLESEKKVKKCLTKQSVGMKRCEGASEVSQFSEPVLQ